MSLNRLLEHKKDKRLDKIEMFTTNRAWMIKLLTLQESVDDMHRVKYNKQNQSIVVFMPMQSVTWYLTTGRLVVNAGNHGSFSLTVEGKLLHDALSNGEEGVRRLKK